MFDNKHPDAIMVALLPKAAFWTKMDFPHLTLVYAGKLHERNRSDQVDIAKTAVQMSSVFNKLDVKVKKPDVLGPRSERVDVLLLEKHPMLLSMRRLLEWHNRSEYKDFKPHVTVGPKGSLAPPIPSVIHFDRIAVCFGEERAVMELR